MILWFLFLLLLGNKYKAIAIFALRLQTIGA